MTVRVPIFYTYQSLLQNGLALPRRCITCPTSISSLVRLVGLHSASRPRRRDPLQPLTRNVIHKVPLRRPTLRRQDYSSSTPPPRRREPDWINKWSDRMDKGMEKDFQTIEERTEDLRERAEAFNSRPDPLSQWKGNKVSKLADWQEAKLTKISKEWEESYVNYENGAREEAARIARLEREKEGKKESTKEAAGEGEDCEKSKEAMNRPRSSLKIVISGLTLIILLDIVVIFYDDSHPWSLDPQSFTAFELVAKQPVSPTSSIFSLRVAPKWSQDAAHQDLKQKINKIAETLGFNPPFGEEAAHPYAQFWRNRIWSVEFKQPEMQISRAYTPLPPDISPTSKPSHPSQLRFLIRREPEGEVSGYLSGLDTGAKIEVRGPNVDFRIPDEVKEIVFLAGGTGIAPALQAVYSLFEARQSITDGRSPRLRILWASRRREDCTGPVVEQLERLQQKHEGRIDVTYFVDEERTLIGRKELDAVMGPTRSDHASASRDHDNDDAAPPPMGDKLVLVSGPEGFVHYLAGPKAWWNGKEKQGALGGILAAVGCRERGWSVWKL